ncbi:hypothetical protein [Palaeococcus ferrophilus]|uniref:hypothetical protein n=1 Tax=Palaeococcus ferrophilus TaxID=83868 RepID=UPI00064EB151|nr:hypothetical protein [Palaeococcus ferrophilus]
MTQERRYFFWFLLASLSALFGEVSIGATLYPFFSPWGILVILPLYGLHTLVLASVVYRFGRPRFETLYLAGVIFGLYEAYITKIIWNPSWESPVQVGGISVFEFLVVVLFWHPFMSFMMPVGVAELLTSRRKLLPGFILKRPLLFALILGALESSNSPSPIHSLLSLASTLGVILALMHLWRRKYEGEDMASLLPTVGELKVLVPFLLAYYITLGLGLNRGAIPGLAPQAFVWAFYALTFYLLYRALMRSRASEVENVGCAPSMGFLLKFSLVWTLSGVLFSTVEGPFHELKFVIIALLWLIGGGIGVVSLVRSARWALRQ